jgi:hypothetical protein
MKTLAILVLVIAAARGEAVFADDTVIRVVETYSNH